MQNLKGEFDRKGATGVPHEPGVWLPIETAPKDGTRILVWIPGDGSHIAAFDPDLEKHAASGWEVFDYDESLTCKPSHWTPLPEPPK